MYCVAFFLFQESPKAKCLTETGHTGLVQLCIQTPDSDPSALPGELAESVKIAEVYTDLSVVLS